MPGSATGLMRYFMSLSIERGLILSPQLRECPVFCDD